MTVAGRELRYRHERQREQEDEARVQSDDAHWVSLPCWHGHRPNTLLSLVLYLPGIETFLVNPQLISRRIVHQQRFIAVSCWPARNGYLLTVACSCGVTFERWVTPEEADADLLRLASLN